MHPPRIIRDRLDTLNIYDDVEFKQRLRISKQTANILFNTIANGFIGFEAHISINPMTQILICLRFYATYQMPISDIFGVERSIVSRIIHRVSRLIASEVSLRLIQK